MTLKYLALLIPQFDFKRSKTHVNFQIQPHLKLILGKKKIYGGSRSVTSGKTPSLISASSPKGVNCQSSHRWIVSKSRRKLRAKHGPPHQDDRPLLRSQIMTPNQRPPRFQLNFSVAKSEPIRKLRKQQPRPIAIRRKIETTGKRRKKLRVESLPSDPRRNRNLWRRNQRRRPFFFAQTEQSE